MKELSIHVYGMAEDDFAESALAFLKPSLEDLGLKLESVHVESHTRFGYNPDMAVGYAPTICGVPAAPVTAPAPVEEAPKTTEAPAEPAPTKPGVIEIDQATLKAKLFEIRDKLGTDALLALYESHGNGAKTFKAIDPECYVTMYAAAEEKLNAAN